jgi:hypothetical protein
VVKKVLADAKKVVKKRNELGGDWANRWLTCTATSEFRQEREPGRINPGEYTIKLAKEADFGDIKIIDHLLPEKLKKELMNCTASKHILPFEHPAVQEYKKKVQELFYRGGNKCHSRKVNQSCKFPCT